MEGLEILQEALVAGCKVGVVRKVGVLGSIGE